MDLLTDFFVQNSSLMFKIVLCSILTGLMGYNREKNGMTIGIRTHIVIGLSAVLIQVTSIDYTNLHSAGHDIFRLSSNILTGVAFVCSGVILKENGSVKGLTTASSIFFAACVGLSVGTGSVAAPIMITAVVYAFLNDLFGIKKKLLTKKNKYIKVKVEINGLYSDYSEDIIRALRSIDVDIDAIEVNTISSDKSKLTLKLNANDEIDVNDILTKLIQIKTISKTEILDVVSKK